MARRKPRSVLRQLYPPDRAAEMEMRSVILIALQSWLESSGITQIQAAKTLGVTQARVSDIKHGKISQFSLDMLVRMASSAGLRPKVSVAA